MTVVGTDKEIAAAERKRTGVNHVGVDEASQFTQERSLSCALLAVKDQDGVRPIWIQRSKQIRDN